MKKLLSIIFLSVLAFSVCAQTKINPAKLLQGQSGGGSLFLKTDNSGNVSFSNNLNGSVISGAGNASLTADLLPLGQGDSRYAQLTGATFIGAINSNSNISTTSLMINSGIVINATDPANYRDLTWRTNGLLRWDLGVVGAEGGSTNAGSNMFLARYGDNGSFLGSVFDVYRATGLLQFNGEVRGVAGNASNSLVVKSQLDALSTAYLGISSTAANSSLLNSQNGSFYQNATNINAGTLSNLRLDPLVSLDNQDNNFSVNQTIPNATSNGHALNRQSGDSRYAQLSGATFTGNVDMSSYGNQRAVKVGFSGGNYGSFSYGINYTATSDLHTYAANDFVTRVDLFKGFRIFAADGGAVGSNVTWTQVADFQKGGSVMYTALGMGSNRITSLGTAISGSDAVRLDQVQNAGIFNTGTVNDAVLSTNVAFRNQVNTFTNINKFYSAEGIIGGFGAVSTAGTTDWNHSTNARSGSGYSLMTGSATNGNGLGGGYYHPFSFEYSTKDGTGNMTQLAIPYSVDNADGTIYLRGRYSGVWTGWQKLLTQGFSDTRYQPLENQRVSTNNVVSHPWYASTVATGTAPLSILSTTLVNNLNADMVDGLHASAFAQLSGAAFSGVVSASDATAATHLMNRQSADARYLGITATATNSGALNGQNGFYYRNASNINSGTLADAQLSTNVPLLNADNAFSGKMAIGGAINSSFNLTVTGSGLFSSNLTVNSALTANTASVTAAATSTTNTQLWSVGASGALEKMNISSLQFEPLGGIAKYSPHTVSAFTADIGGGVLKHILTLDCENFYMRTFRVNISNVSSLGARITFTNAKPGGLYTINYFNGNGNNIFYEQAKKQDGTTDFGTFTVSGMATHRFSYDQLTGTGFIQAF